MSSGATALSVLPAKFEGRLGGRKFALVTTPAAHDISTRSQLCEVGGILYAKEINILEVSLFPMSASFFSARLIGNRRRSQPLTRFTGPNADIQPQLFVYDSRRKYPIVGNPSPPDL